MPEGLLVIKVSKHKMEELARKWEMSSVDELLQADPHKDVIQVQHPEDFMFQITNHQHDRGQEGDLLQEPSFAMVARNNVK